MTRKCVNCCVHGCAERGVVCSYAAWIASLHATEQVKKLSKDSRVFSSRAPRFHQIKPHHMEMGKVLGTGGFSHVHECKLISSPNDEESTPLAVKHLSHETMTNRAQFIQGAADLATEACFLHTLRHPNIVTLHGIRSGAIKLNVAAGNKDGGFFLVLDRLDETLRHKMNHWANKKRSRSSGSKTPRQQQRHVQQVVEIASAIADALEYLHSMGIVFRDLKPDNIGFDSQGQVKLFDFGLAKELKEGRKSATSGGYNMTGKTGSARYMAPEVARQMPYDQSVDVYSFGVLLNELLQARGVDVGVSDQENDSKDSSSLSEIVARLQRLVRKCCLSDPSKRPDFASIRRKLAKSSFVVLTPTENEAASKSANKTASCLVRTKDRHSLHEKADCSFLSSPASLRTKVGRPSRSLTANTPRYHSLSR